MAKEVENVEILKRKLAFADRINEQIIGRLLKIEIAYRKFKAEVEELLSIKK